MKWLYKVVEVPHSELAKFLSDSSLALYGAGSWELVQILDTRGFVLAAIFKKLDVPLTATSNAVPFNSCMPAPTPQWT